MSWQTVQRGFSLLETLVALVILSLALGVLYQSTSTATGSALVSSQYAVATALAESVLDDFTTGAVAGTSANGEFEGFSWQVTSVPEVSDLGAASSPTDASVELSRIVVTVSWAGIGRAREIRLETVAGLPFAPQS